MSQDLLLLHRNEYYYAHSPKVSRLLEGPISHELVSSYASRKTLERFVLVLSQTMQVNPDLVTLYHGAEDALFKMLSWAASQRMKVYTTSWGWAEYMRMMQGLELEIRQTRLIRTTNSFEHPSDDFECELKNDHTPALVLLASPNNPTGHAVSPAEISRLAQTYPHHVFLIDQVYAPFCSATFAPLSGFKNVITLGSFSKFFGLPGLRCGFAVGRVPAVQSMALGPAPWALSLCLAALHDVEHYQSNWNDMKASAEALTSINSSVGHFIKTLAPFVLFSGKEGLTEDAIQKAQAEAQVQGKIIKTHSEVFVRWSLGSPEAQSRISSCLQILESTACH